MTKLLHATDAEVCVLRLYTIGTEPDIWYHEDLHLAPDALAATRDLADESGLEYDSFGPAKAAGEVYFNDIAGGREYVRRAAKRHWAAWGARDKLTLAPWEERRRLPPPKVLAA